MARICGYLDLTAPKDTIRLMTETMIHRPWDASCAEEHGPIALGTITSHAPPLCARKGPIIMYAIGNIYNLGAHPSKTLLDLYHTHGNDIGLHLDGTYLLVVCNTKTHAITLISDRYGMQPCYLYHDDKRLVFGSEIKSILAHPAVPRRINWHAWGEFAAFGHPLGNNTFFTDITRLGAATTFTKTPNNTTQRAYRTFNSLRPLRTSSDRIIGEVCTRLAHSIPSLKHANTLLTGGWDSRTIATLLHNKHIPFDAWTTRKEGDGYADPTLAQHVAQELCAPHHFIDLPPTLYPDHFTDLFYILDGQVNEHLFIAPLLDALPQHTPIFDGLVGDILLQGRYENEASMHPSPSLARTLCAQSKASALPLIFTRNTAAACTAQLEQRLLNEMTAYSGTPNPLTAFTLMNEGRRKVALTPFSLLTTKRPSTRHSFTTQSAHTHSPSRRTSKADNCTTPSAPASTHTSQACRAQGTARLAAPSVTDASAARATPSTRTSYATASPWHSCEKPASSPISQNTPHKPSYSTKNSPTACPFLPRLNKAASALTSKAHCASTSHSGITFSSHQKISYAKKYKQQTSDEYP